MTSTTIIPEDRPSLAKKVIEALAHKPKRAVLKVIVEMGQARAGEIAKRLNLRLPTVLQHLEDLAAAGLIKVQEAGPRRLKVYTISSEKIRMELDIKLFLMSEEPRQEYVEELAKRYIHEKRKKGQLPAAPAVIDIKKTLHIKVEEALLVADLMHTRPSTVLDELIDEAIKAIEERPGMRISDLAKRLSTSQYWATLLASTLLSKGRIRMEGGKLYPVTAS